jgi:hypothetical protein
MRPLKYKCLFFLCLGAAVLPLRAAADDALGVVEVSRNANLDGLDAVQGSNFYGGEEFVTSRSGGIQLRVHQCRLELGELTSARFLPDSMPDHLLLIQGVARFSCPRGATLLIDTPAGVIRGAEGMPSSGMINVTDAHNLTVSAYDQSLLLDNDGELHLIGAGQTYRIAVTQEASPRQDGRPPRYAVNNHPLRRRIAMSLIFGAPIAYAGVTTWCEITESPSTPEKEGCW